MADIWESQVPFYRSIFDRYKFIELMFEKERKEAGLTHEQLAERCNTPFVKLYHLTTIQNLTKTISNPRHRMDRVRLLMSLTWGLQLTRWKVDFLLTLFDGKPLTNEEFQRYLSHYQDSGEAEAKNYDLARLKHDFIRAIDELIQQSARAQGEPMLVHALIRSTKPPDDTGNAQNTLELESRPGMGLVIRAEPLYLTAFQPRTVEELALQLQARHEPDGTPIAAETLLERFELETRRHENFLHVLDRYGHTSIHSKPTIRHLLARRDPLRSSFTRQQLYRCTDLLWHYDNFNVGLAENTPALELKITGFERALMVGASNFLFERANWGPTHVLWTDSSVVLRFIHDFWENFDALPTVDRERSSVITSLCDWAELPHPKQRTKRDAEVFANALGGE